MTAPNPSLLTDATRFPPAHIRSRSRSPSRSPLRKSQFAARELDPLLSNLSPDSTLRALQVTSAISREGPGQDALAKSIAEASPAEREFGIRAAVAAQKLKEWHKEVLKWPWPIRRDRGWGAGFLSPQQDSDGTPTPEDGRYLGFLPTSKVAEFQERIEDIRDGIEALDLDMVKDHVFNAHIPQRSFPAPGSVETASDTKSTGYGRMRDFTALITATVIQALPELANLIMLLDTWDIRLTVLRQIPLVTQLFRSTRAGVQTAFSVVRSMETGSFVTMEEYETTKSILGGKVAHLGTQIDKLLDMLEGQEDSLPKNWIDALEHIENEYATWVVEAEHIAIRNGLLAKALAERPRKPPEMVEINPSGSAQQTADTKPSIGMETASANIDPHNESQAGAATAEPASESFLKQPSPRRKSPLKPDGAKKMALSIKVPSSGHNRGVSEVSMAESTFSAMSDLSNAEIVDARSTQVVTSPQINVVENPLRLSRDALSLFPSPTSTLRPPEFRPAMLQRASTASIEVIHKDSVKKVHLTRSRSHDLLGQISPPSPYPSTPTTALQQLTGAGSRHTSSSETVGRERESPQPVPHHGLPHVLTGSASEQRVPTEMMEHHREAPHAAEHGSVQDTASSTVSPSPSLRVLPLQFKAKDNEVESLDMPELPRRSSKRLSRTLENEMEQMTPLSTVPTSEKTEPPPINMITPVQQVKEHPSESLEAKIKDILNTMPTRIRLAQESDGNDPRNPTSTSSIRSSTPLPALTLSPVKVDRTSRHADPGDIRVFHLTRSGQSRDTPPVKLFVRAVGEDGERVMVRVGGGWADLAEYLREYSLHHGHRGLAHRNLEVASFPTPPKGQHDMSTAPASTSAAGQSQRISLSSSTSDKRRSLPIMSSGSGDLPSLQVGKVRKNGAMKSTEWASPVAEKGWTPPPVPPIPATYTMQGPTTVTTTSDGATSTSTISPANLGFNPQPRHVSAPVSFSTSTNGQSMSSITTSSPHHSVSNYTPLGAAGPKLNGRRAVTQNAPSYAARESWVEGMVGKARAVSGGTTVYQGPTTTTTTTVTSRPSPTSRRVSALPKPLPTTTPASSPGTASPGTSGSPVDSSSAQNKSRLSLGDMSGIRRVFLRRKSDK